MIYKKDQFKCCMLSLIFYVCLVENYFSDVPIRIFTSFYKLQVASWHSYFLVSTTLSSGDDKDLSEPLGICVYGTTLQGEGTGSTIC